MATYTDDQGNTFASIQITWDANTELDLAYYVVEWSRDNSDWQSMQVDSGSTSCKIEGLACGEDYYFRVKAVDKAGNESSYSNVNSGNPITMSTDSSAPDEVTNLTAYSLNKAVKLTWDNPSQNDFAYCKVYRNNTNSYNGSETLLAEVDGSSFTDQINTRDATFYYSVKTVDESGNVSSGCSWVSGSTDTDNPDAPSSLSVTSGTITDADGHIIPYLQCSWTDSSTSDVVDHEVQVWFDLDDDASYADEDPETHRTEGTPLRIMGVPGNVDYRVRVRAIDDAGFKSSWTAYDTGTTPKDNTAPGTPSNLSVTAALKAIRIEVDEPSDSDWVGCEFHVSDSDGFTPGAGTLVHAGRSTSHLHKTDDYNTKYVRVRAYDSSGNYSSYTTQGSATPSLTSNDDLDSDIDDSKVVIDTGVSLDDWHYGGGEIDGAKLHSLAVDKLAAGSLGIDMTMGSGGYISAFSGTWDSDATGWRLTQNEIEGQNSGATQVKISSSTGKLTAAAGDVILDADGLTLNSGIATGNIIKWDHSGSSCGEIYTGIDAAQSQMEIVSKGVDTGGAILTLIAQYGGNSVALELDEDNDRVQISAPDTRITDDLRVGAGLYVGSTLTDPADDTIVADDYICAIGGLWVGQDSDPGADNLYVDGDARIGGGAVIGTTGTSPSVTLELRDNVASNMMYMQNDGAAANRGGITMDMGEDSNPTAEYLLLRDGDGTKVGDVTGDGSGGVGYNSESDVRIKDVIGALPVESALEALQVVAPIAYTARGGGPERHGFGAQHLEPVTKGVVRYDEEIDRYSMDYGRLTPYLWRGWQHHQARIDALEAEIVRLGGDPNRLNIRA